jgi:hypothetical protein
MIHISTEELFRNIKTDQNCNFGEVKANDNDKGNEHNPSESASSKLLEQEGRPKRTTKNGEATSARSSACYSELSPTGVKFGRDMSSILPAMYGNTRDKNNNSISIASNEDEVQAVLITGKLNHRQF